MTPKDTSRGGKKSLRLTVSCADYEKLRREADMYGFTLSGLLRIRMLEKVKGLNLVRKPSADMKLLGDILGLLTALTIEISKIGRHLELIGVRLGEASRDLFGLDGALRQFEAFSQKIVKAFHLIEQAITGNREKADERRVRDDP